MPARQPTSIPLPPTAPEQRGPSSSWWLVLDSFHQWSPPLQSHQSPCLSTVLVHSLPLSRSRQSISLRDAPLTPATWPRSSRASLPRVSDKPCAPGMALARTLQSGSWPVHLPQMIPNSTAPSPQDRCLHRHQSNGIAVFQFPRQTDW